MPTKRYRNRVIEIDTIRIGSYNEDVASTPLLLDRESLLYRATYAGATYESKDAEEVKRQVTEAMRAANTVTWQGVIEVSWGSNRPNHGLGLGASSYSYVSNEQGAGNLHFAFSRKLYARFPDGKLRSCYWDCPPNHRQKNAHAWAPRVYGVEDHKAAGGDLRTDKPFTPPCRGADFQGNPENTVYLPFSENVWHGLTLLTEATSQLNERLGTLLSTPEGHARLAAAALPFALPAPAAA